MEPCYCGQPLSFQNCCEPYINGTEKAPTPEILMRSRYSAYATAHADYLISTTHSSTRKLYEKAAILKWARSNQWLKLEVLQTTNTTVTFKAYFLDKKLIAQVHHEHSIFIFEKDSWFYASGLYE